MSDIARVKGISARNVTKTGNKKKTRKESKQLLKNIAETFNHCQCEMQPLGDIGKW